MKRKRRRGRKHKARVSAVRPTQVSTTLRMPELPRPSQVIERSSLAKAGELAERHQYALAEVKRSVVTGGAIFTLLIALYLLLS